MIFGIGLPRTGTGSASIALGVLGYRPLHHARFMGNLIDFNRWRGAKLLALADESFDAFFDGPIRDIFPELDAQYPNSKFLWTVRDEESWVGSVLAYCAQLREKGQSAPTATEEEWREKYRAHEALVTAHLSERILRWDICGGELWEPVCRFLGKPAPAVPFPCANATRRRVVCD